MTTRLEHNRIALALHALRPGQGSPLLLLHGLGERSPEAVPPELASWPGAIHALDFTGHGASTLPTGGGYTAEVLMGDADVALAHLGPATVVGRGLGGYVGLLLAGGRPSAVRGLIVRDGPGLAGGGGSSPTPRVSYIPPSQPSTPDPFALDELSRDVRPPDYATQFVRAATQLSELTRPISVCALARPAWLSAVVQEVGVEQTPLKEALTHYSTGAT